MLLLMLMNLPNILFGFVQERYWKRIESWRFVASLGNERLLADEQPEPRAAALPVSTAIKIRQLVERRLYIGFLFFFVWYIAALSFFACITLFATFSLWPWALLIAVLIGGLFALGMFFLLRIHHSMEITEDGIRVRSTPGGFTTLIFWHEMRLFACYPEPGARNGDGAMVYELSSGSQVVYWTWMRKKNLLNTIMGPSMPLEEHHLQMQALCSLISAKTGLPLYDLSKGTALRLEETAEAR
jgi:MFS family permease